MLNRLLSWTGIIPRATGATPPCRPGLRRLRLGCESLEARDVPAVYMWNPTFDPITGAEELNDSAALAYNWTDAAGVRYDDPPGADDDLYFTDIGYENPNGAPSFPSTDCVIDSVSGGTFAGVHLLAGYVGTVRLNTALTVGTFEQRGGAVAQSGSGLNAYVTNAFTFTGGTLNNTTNLGTVHLQGATGAIVPTGGGSVELGSTLSLEARDGIGATVDVEPGTLSLANAADIVVDSLCQFKLPPRPGDVPVVIQPKLGSTDVGVLKLKGLNSTTVLDQPLVQKIGLRLSEGAKVTILKNTTFSGLSQTQLPGEPPPANIGILDSTIIVKNGVTLTANIAINGGFFLTIPIENAPVGTDQRVVIDGSIAFFDGWLELGYGSTAGAGFSVLEVKGNLNLIGGRFAPRLNGQNQGQNDIVTAETMKTSVNFRVEPSVINPPQGGVAGKKWNVLSVDESFVGNDAPTVPQGWLASRVGKKFYVEKS